jgi:aminomethyltransferase
MPFTKETISGNRPDGQFCRAFSPFDSTIYNEMFTMAARSALYETLAAAGARMGEYRGAGTALGWKPAAAEFSAFHSGAVVFDLGWRTKLLVSGEHRIRWMNGMVTNNIRDLAVGFGTYNFLLNPQGRIQADLYVYNRGEYLVVDSDASQAEKLQQTFRKYIIMDRVEISDAAGKLTSIGIGGEKSAAILGALGLPVELGALEIRDALFENIGISIVRADTRSYEVWVSPENAAAVWNALLRAGAQPVGAEALELVRIASGVPRYGQDISDRDLPQETEQARALNFRKGCYIGQEIVERINSRGQVHRKFTGFRFTGAAPSPGTKVESNGKEVGEITSVAVLPLAGQESSVALGYIRREAGTPGAEVMAGGTRATVANLPFEPL